MISKVVRDEWRRLAENTQMTSAVGEYTPTEFIELLDAVDELESQVHTLQKALCLHRSMVLCGEEQSPQSEALFIDAMNR